MTYTARNERRRMKRLNADCPPKLMMEIRVAIAAGIKGKGIKAGDTFGDLVHRHCPEAFQKAEDEGYLLDLDLPENTHEALIKGYGNLIVKRRTRH